MAGGAGCLARACPVRAIGAMSEQDTTHTQSHSSSSDAGWALSAAGREAAEAYLKEHTRLARLQADDIVREDKIRHW